MHSSRFFLCLLLTFLSEFITGLSQQLDLIPQAYSPAYSPHNYIRHPVTLVSLTVILFCCSLLVIGFSFSLVLKNAGRRVRRWKRSTHRLLLRRLYLKHNWSMLDLPRFETEARLLSPYRPPIFLSVTFSLCFSSPYLFFTFAIQLKRSIWILCLKWLGDLSWLSVTS